MGGVAERLFVVRRAMWENVAMREALSPRARTLVADKAAIVPRNGREASMFALPPTYST